jgi:hypothetical protein
MIFNIKTKKQVKTFLSATFTVQDRATIETDFVMRWRIALDDSSYHCFKLYAEDSPNIHGLLCIEILPPIFVIALESATFNRSSDAQQRYKGVGTELLAHACLLSKQNGFQGRILIESKEETIAFYEQAGGRREGGTNFFIFEGATSNNLMKRL